MTAIPGAFGFIQQESVQFNNPNSEASLSAIGATVNGLLSIILPVGTIVDSMLTESQFQTEIGNLSAPFLWVLADGRNVAGSTYATVTGNTTIPDLRGIFTRGKNNGRSDGNQNPDGDLALGTYTADKLASHTHTDAGHGHGVNDPGHAHVINAGPFGTGGGAGNLLYADDATTTRNDTSNVAGTGISIQTGFASIQATGGNETAPKTVTINKFIRIN